MASARRWGVFFCLKPDGLPNRSSSVDYGFCLRQGNLKWSTGAVRFFKLRAAPPKVSALLTRLGQVPASFSAKNKTPVRGASSDGGIGDEKHQTNRAPTGIAKHIVVNGMERVTLDRMRTTTGQSLGRCNTQRRSSGI